MHKAKGLAKAFLVGASIIVIANAVAAFLLPPGDWQEAFPMAGLIFALIVVIPMVVARATPEND